MAQHFNTHGRRGGKRRGFSQNFIIDRRVSSTLAQVSGIGPDDHVVEIGPGSGALTRALVGTAAQVTAYEIDPYFASRLSLRYRDNPRVRCVHRDFLATSPPRDRFHVVANIPFSRTAAIVNWCLNSGDLVSATLLTQWEYARKHTGDYGRWTRQTVMTWPTTEWRLSGRVDRHKFHPIPRVDSGILRIVKRSVPLLRSHEMAAYRECVELGYSGLGGSVYASLRRRFRARDLDAGFAALGLDRRMIVGQLSPGEWIALFDRLRRL